MDPLGPIAFRGVRTSHDLEGRKSITTCDFPGGGVPNPLSPSGSTHDGSSIDSPIAYAHWKETEAVIPKFQTKKTISPQGMEMSSAKSNDV